MKKISFLIPIIFFIFGVANLRGQNSKKDTSVIQKITRQHLKINEGWCFMWYNSTPDNLIYDVRPKVEEVNDSKVADSKPTEAIKVQSKEQVLKS